jgi:hypothetical protein
MCQSKRSLTSGILALLSLFAIFALSACSNPVGAPPSTGTTPGGTSGGTPGATPAATATGATGNTSSGGSATCAQALPGAHAVPIGPSFPDLPLPPGSVSTTPVKTAGGGDGQFTLWQVDLCVNGTSAAAVRSSLGTLPGHGWLHSDWFPADAEAESACTTSCWAKDVRYVSLDQVADQGQGVVTYRLKVATPPPAPNCSTSFGVTGFSSGYYYFLYDKPAYPGITDGFDHIALPPLTKLGFDAAAGNRYAALCSAGSPAMVKSFLDKHLRAVGWVPEGGGLYKYANKYEIAIENGPAPDIKALLHWPVPYNYP